MILHNASFDAVLMFSLKLSADKSLAEGFKLEEFASKDGLDQVLVHPMLVNGLTVLRDWAGAPVKINSAFRSVWHNSKVGGISKSKHLLGMAADVSVVGKSPDEVATWAEGIGWGGVGRYNSFTHLDVAGINRRWDKRT